MINHAKIYTGQHVLGNAWQGFKPRYLPSSIKTPLGMYKIDLLEVVAGKARKRYVVTDNGR
jgi:hypothetical protein